MESESEGLLRMLAHLGRHRPMVEKFQAEFRAEFATRETRLATTPVRLQDRSLLLDEALCRHREILKREVDFLRGEVKSRGFATLAGKKDYMNSKPNRRTISPPLLFSSELFASVEVSLPHLVTNPQESLDLLLHELHDLRYRIESLSSILKKFSIPVSNNKATLRLSMMSITAAMTVKSMKYYSKKDATSSHRLHREHWESIWGSEIASHGVFDDASHGVFDDITTLSPTHFTPSTPGIVPYTATAYPALQIYSFKIVELNDNLNWPLRVYGVVAARDTVDRNRNLLFYRSRANYQLVTENDPFLRLTGPSRAIVSGKPVTFEVELKIKYPGEEGQDDRALFFSTYTWRSMLDTTLLFSGYACEAELSLGWLPDAIQATILSVRLVNGIWPSKYGCRVSCFLSAAEEKDPTPPREVELLNCPSLDEAKKNPVASGYFALARNVVSAQLQSTLEVVIQATGGPSRGHVKFPVKQYCQTSKKRCFVGKCNVEVVVAWSLLVEERLKLMI